MRGGRLLALVLLVAGQGGASGQAGVATVAFAVDQVVPVRVAPGFAIVIEFAADEAVDNVVVGNSAAWQVTPSRRGNRLVVKPLANATTTNMIVVTDARRYIFRLDSDEGGEQPSVLRFDYPPAISVAPAEAAIVGTYRLQGARALFPAEMGDDGTRTTIRWTRAIDLPAVFAVTPKGGETLVNGRMVGDDYVIEGVAPRYVFRAGTARAVATRRIERARR